MSTRRSGKRVWARFPMINWGTEGERTCASFFLTERGISGSDFDSCFYKWGWWFITVRKFASSITLYTKLENSSIVEYKYYENKYIIHREKIIIKFHVLQFVTAVLDINRRYLIIEISKYKFKSCDLYVCIWGRNASVNGRLNEATIGRQRGDCGR